MFFLNRFHSIYMTKEDIMLLALTILTVNPVFRISFIGLYC